MIEGNCKTLGWSYQNQNRQCTNRAKYGDFCGVHSPEQQKKRREARGPSASEREFAWIRARAHVVSVARGSCERFQGVEFDAIREALKKLDELK